MNRKLLYLLSIALLASCSAPKYTYNFGYYDYDAGKRKVAQAEVNNQSSETVLHEEQAAPLELTASVEQTPSPVSKPRLAPSTQAEVPLLSAKYKDLSKEERKEFRKEVMHAAKKDTKADGKEKASGDTDIPLWAYILFAILLPPLAVGLYEGIHGPFWLSILLTLLFWLPGVIYAVWRVTKK